MNQLPFCGSTTTYLADKLPLWTPITTLRLNDSLRLKTSSLTDGQTWSNFILVSTNSLILLAVQNPSLEAIQLSNKTIQVWHDIDQSYKTKMKLELEGELCQKQALHLSRNFGIYKDCIFHFWYLKNFSNVASAILYFKHFEPVTNNSNMLCQQLQQHPTTTI